MITVTIAQLRENLTQRRYDPVVVHNYCRNRQSPKWKLDALKEVEENEREAIAAFVRQGR
jgi:hypothetical protein